MLAGIITIAIIAAWTLSAFIVGSAIYGVLMMLGGGDPTRNSVERENR